jgi:charged multivesicular body protein 2A
MVKLNKQVKLPELQKVMMEFAKQSEQMEMKQEVNKTTKKKTESN